MAANTVVVKFGIYVEEIIEISVKIEAWCFVFHVIFSDSDIII